MMGGLIFLFLCSQVEATIDVDLTGATGDTIKPYIYGGFIEFLGFTINHKAGLWAQEIGCRGFEVLDTNGVAEGWFPITQGNNSCLFELDTTRYNRIGSYSQKIEITSYTDGHSGVGQFPIIIKSGESYDVYLYLKGAGIEGSITLWLTDSTDKVCDSLTFYGVNEDWTKFSGVLTPITSEHYGAFAITFQEEGILWIDEVSLVPHSAIDGVRKGYFDLILLHKPNIMRYPGGCFADGDGSHWLNGVGDIDQRPPNWDNHWGRWERMDFGTDEFVQFCQNTNMEPQITVNFGSGTPEEAANWVEYTNCDTNTTYGRMRAENGSIEPYNIKYWEVGNEQYGEWEIGHTTSVAYATQFIDFTNQMKAVDPSIKVMANGCDNREWTDTVLAIAGDVMDYISIHFTCPGLEWDTATYTNDEDEVYRAMVAAPLVFAATGARLKNAIDSLTSGDVRIAVTEWWMSYGRDTLYTKHFSTLETALYVAGMLNLFQQSSFILDIANWSTLGGAIGHQFHPSFEFYAYPVLYVYSLYSNYSGEVPISFTVDCSTYASLRVGNILAMDSVPYLDVSVTRSDNKIYINVVNRKLEDIETAINIVGGAIESEAVVRTINGPHFLSNNNDAPHNTVIIRDSSLSGISENFVYTFPAHSVTGIELTTSVGVERSMPSEKIFSLKSPAPNPFYKSILVQYEVPELTHITLKLCDVTGRVIKTLVDKKKSPGCYTVPCGSELPSGIYFLRMEAGSFKSTRKFIKVK